MSLDFDLTEKYIKIKLSDLTCEEYIETVYSRNITHNVNIMWKESGCYEALYESDGKKAVEIIPILKDAIEKMGSDPEKYKKMNAPNGWGTYESAFNFLTNVFKACFENPNSIINIDK